MLKKILTDSCILFTVFVFILLSVNCLFVPADEGIVSGLSFETSLLLFISAVLLRIYYGVLSVKTIPLPLRVIINYVLVVGTGYGVIKLINTATNRQQNSLSLFVILAALALIYSAVIIIVFAIKGKKNEKKNEEKEYKSIV
ncbi:MAG: hypothetical protein IJ002_06015 [Clostridia bacterium]|nr:hypothetical protein [Clostridia bacterium]